MEKTALIEKTFESNISDGKHLVFKIGERDYGIPILDISEIDGRMEITKVPKSPEYIKGVINRRGKILPGLDLRLKLGLPPREYDDLTCIIIANLFVKNVKKQMGIIVDTVSEVFNIPLDEIENPPKYSTDNNNEFLSGIGKIKGKMVMLLNIQNVVYTDEILDFLAKG